MSPRSGTRQRRVVDDTRERILREASELFARQGYSGTTTRDIAEAVGVRQPSLFHHFPSKSAILKTLISIDLGAASAALEDIHSAKASPAAQLYRFLLFDTSHLLRSPYNLAGLYTNGELDKPEFRAERRQEKRLYSSVQGLIEAGIEIGQFTALDVVSAREIILAVDLHTMRLARGRRLRDRAGFASDVAKFVVRGLLEDSSELPAVVAEAAEITVPALP